MSHGPVFAASSEVTSALDDNTNCTLREAITSINNLSATRDCINSSNESFGVNDSITFASNLGGTIILQSGSLEISSGSSVAIDASALDNGMTLIGDSQTRVVSVSEAQLKIDKMTITGGNGGISAISSNAILNKSTVTGNALTGLNAGGIFANGGSVTLNDSKVVENSAFNGGGVFALGSSVVNLNNSSISNNTASNSAGGIFLTNLTTANTSTVANLNDSTVSGNIAEDFGTNNRCSFF